jgi:hypothetical protein
MESTFKTKTGFCHVTEDKIILTRDGVVGNVSKVVVGNNILRILIIYGLLSSGLLFFAYNNYLNGDLFATALFGLLGLYLIIGIFKSLNNSTTPVIERSDIRSLKFIKGITGVTRSRFEIEFDEAGKTKKRLILLPGSLTGGETETENAIKIMRSEKLLDGSTMT